MASIHKQLIEYLKGDKNDKIKKQVYSLRRSTVFSRSVA